MAGSDFLGETPPYDAAMDVRESAMRLAFLMYPNGNSNIMSVLDSAKKIEEYLNGKVTGAPIN